MAESLFNSEFSKTVREAVLQTRFFEGMKNNSLSPDEYGGYMVQDVAFTYDSIDALNTAAKSSESSPEFVKYYKNRVRAYTRFCGRFCEKVWRLKNSQSVMLNAAVTDYVDARKKLAETNPEYLCINLLAGELLLPWVAKTIDSSVPKTHLYRAWVDNNNRHYHTTERFVNKMFSDISNDEKETCQGIFNMALILELNFFRSACGEVALEYDDFKIKN
jgi:thiaminase